MKRKYRTGKLHHAMPLLKPFSGAPLKLPNKVHGKDIADSNALGVSILREVAEEYT